MIQLSYAHARGEATSGIEGAILEAARAGIHLVAAAGVGDPNPYQPMRLSNAIPQAMPEVTVVGAVSGGAPSEHANTGPELDFVAEAEENDSVLASGQSAGLLGKLHAEKKGVSASEARLRSLTRGALVDGERFEPDLMGFGVLDPSDFSIEVGHRTMRYKSPASGIGIDFNSAEAIRAISATSECAGPCDGRAAFRSSASARDVP